MPPDKAENGSREQAELNNVEVVEDSPNMSEKMEALSTFTELEGPFSYKLIPVIKGGSTSWRIVVYMDGAQGPAYQSVQGVTDDAASKFGMSRKLQDRLNDALEHANRELELPRGLGNQELQDRPLHELEGMME